MTRFSVALLVLAAAGCSSSSPSGGGDDGDTPALTIGIEPWEVQQGEDRLWCKTMKVPGDASTVYDVSRIRITMPEGSHHFILYRSEQSLPDGFGECEEMDRTFVTGSQTAGTFETRYPDGKAVPLFGGEQLILESHYANAGPALTAYVDVELFTVPHEDVKDYLQTILVPYTDFSIPASTTGYVDGMTVPEIDGFNTWQISSHMHQRGVRFTADRLVPGEEPQRFYVSEDWHSPVIKTFDDPMAWDGDNQVRFECTWNNETGAPIGHGPTTDDEMCILVVTFFPAYSYSP